MRYKTKKPGRVLKFVRPSKFYITAGDKRFESGDFLSALSFYRQALERDPDNVEAAMSVSSALTQLGRFGESNMLLLQLTARDDCPRDCLFAIACNLMSQNDLRLAERWLLMFDEQCDDDDEILPVVEDMLDSIYDAKAKAIRDAQSAKGKRLLNDSEFAEVSGVLSLASKAASEGDSDAAVKMLEPLAKKYDDIAAIQSSLAFVYHCGGSTEKAVRLLERLAAKDPADLQSRCTLAMIYHDSGNELKLKESVKTLARYETDDPHDLMRIGALFCDIGDLEHAKQIYTRFYSLYPDTAFPSHCLAVCCMKQGNCKRAEELYETLFMINPHDSIAAYYKNLCTSPEEVEKAVEAGIPYEYQVPLAEVFRRLELIGELPDMPRDEFIRKWAADDAYSDTVGWALETLTFEIKQACMEILNMAGDAKARRILREFILLKEQEDAVKYQAAGALKELGEPEPYIMYMGGEYIQMRMAARQDRMPQQAPAAYFHLLRTVTDTMAFRRPNPAIRYAEDMTVKFADGYETRAAPSKEQQEAIAAAIEIRACEEFDEYVDEEDIMQLYAVTRRRLDNAKKKLDDALGTDGAE